MKQSSLERIVFLAIGQERERCAKIAEEIEIETAPYDPTKSKKCASFAYHQRFHAARIAAAIRRTSTK